MPADLKCPYCRRPCRECWQLPCLEVQRILPYISKVRAWLENAGYSCRIRRPRGQKPRIEVSDAR